MTTKRNQVQAAPSEPTLTAKDRMAGLMQYTQDTENMSYRTSLKKAVCGFLDAIVTTTTVVNNGMEMVNDELVMARNESLLKSAKKLEKLQQDLDSL